VQNNCTELVLFRMKQNNNLYNYIASHPPKF
jgi:hypothetical protein